ncbi:MAG: membrane protein insertase YidC [Alphaproteobacteria bacterium]|jgi:YidC/Oxa1 family membrane protein insertase|nr:membrane protein insertase YidC [Alphaproteobacteria bacterium]MDP6516611.1 membrane protein insertase YidC [Alphaproteobacteria bacterium]
MTDQKNLVLAIVLSVVILFGFQMIFGTPPPQTPPAPQTDEQRAQPTGPVSETRPTPPAAPVDAETARAGALEDTVRVAINPDLDDGRVTGSIALRGGRIDDLVLRDYQETVEPDSDLIVLLSPAGAPSPYYAKFGWEAEPGSTVAVPDAEAEWQANAGRLTADAPVTLTWDNGDGLRFSNRIEIDDQYMFTVTQRVENHGDTPVVLRPNGLINRTDEPSALLGFYILHEGPLGVFDGTLQEVDYDDLREKQVIPGAGRQGWIGITDKYWLVALIPDQQSDIDALFSMAVVDRHEKFQVDFKQPALTIAARGAAEVTNRLFAGAKEVNQLDRYEQSLGISRFDLAVDFGWFYFLTKPLFYVIHYLHDVLGNIGLAILAVTVMIKLVFFPLANKSYVAMSRMKKLQPEMTKLREKFSDDKRRQQQEMMDLYKREKANPLAGCLPILVQIPVFFALYKVLFVTLEMRHAPFYGWIRDLSARDPTSLFNLFGLVPWTPPDFLGIGVWPLIMGITMWLQQKLNPPPPDPTQARIMMMLPFVFTFMFATFPAGLVIYWAWNNLLSIAQQYVIMRRMGVKV